MFVTGTFYGDVKGGVALPVGCHVWRRSCCCCGRERRSSETWPSSSPLGPLPSRPWDFAWSAWSWPGANQAHHLTADKERGGEGEREKEREEDREVDKDEGGRGGEAHSKLREPIKLFSCTHKGNSECFYIHYLSLCLTVCIVYTVFIQTVSPGEVI